MSYKQDLIQTIKDSAKWPSLERPNFLIDLNVIADEALKKESIEGYLAALLIYHQLCEELVRLILKNAHFFIQLSIFPTEINFPEKRRLMFGQLIEELKETMSFDNKEDFISKCLELNKHRIEIVHNLTRRTTLTDIKSQVEQAKNLYDEIYDLFERTHDHFRLCFKDFRKDIDWDDYLSE